MAQMNGQSAGVWHRFNGKSLVWYPKAQFEAAGYEVPTTWDELVALMDTIVADGDTPGASASNPVSPPVGPPPTGPRK